MKNSILQFVRFSAAVSMAVTIGTTAHAGVIYEQEFLPANTPAGARLNGVEPTTTTDSETWDAHRMWGAAGDYYSKCDEISGVAALKFEPKPGKTYVLTTKIASMHLPGGAPDHENWTGVGFKEAKGQTALNAPESGGLWFLVRDPIVASEDGTQAVFADSGARLVGQQEPGITEFQLVLDTKKPKWETTLYIDGNEVDVFTFPGAVKIGAVALQGFCPKGYANGYVKYFKLEEKP